MEPTLRKLAVIVGIGLLGVSIFWSQDGFNFDLSGTSGYGNLATFIGWFLALSVTVVQFVFSTSYKELNASLKFFGILAYIYSIYTNYWGILNFQGWTDGQPEFQFGGAMLAFVMDGVPEPLIAWGLYESLSGDFIGNLLKVFGQPPQNSRQHQGYNQGSRENNQRREQVIQTTSQPDEYSSQMLQQSQQSRTQRHDQMRQQGNVPPFLANKQQKRS